MNIVPRGLSLLSVLVGFVALAVCPVLAAPPKMGPVNPQFKDYLRLKAAGHWATKTPDGHGLGWRPSPVPPIRPVVSPEFFPWSKRAKAFAARFDLRDVAGKLSPIRDQGNAGTCWAFGTYSSMESCLRPGNPQDFSENNLKNLSGFGWGWNDGGNASMSTAYLARWSGPVLESEDPYDDMTGTSSPPGLSAYMHSQNITFLPTRANSLDNDAIKTAVSTYGAVYASYINDWTCYNGFNYYYGTTGTSIGGHAVAIVGWDDNYPATNFTARNGNPPGNGAFIMRNSWGTGWGQSGYYYISYYDIALGYRDLAVFHSPAPNTNYASVVGYDPLGWVGSWTVPYAANRFPASGSDCSLRAVGVYSTDPGTGYQIEVYLNPTSGPRTGGTLAGTVSGSFPDAGYYTVPFPAPINLGANDSYSIITRMTSASAVEYPYDDYSPGATASPGQSYYSVDDTVYTDLTSIYPTMNFCIKAFTGPAALLAPQIAMLINDPSGWTTDNSVTLRLSRGAGGAPAEVCFADDDDGSPGTWSAWEPWTTSKSWTLPGSYGTKTVWAKARNTTGEGIAISASIDYREAQDILLVDNDGGGTCESYYETALTAARQTYDKWTVATDGAIPAERLLEYAGSRKSVIWFTGTKFSSTLTASDQAALAAFLEAGGRLFISGQDIGYDLVSGNKGRDFYSTYLHADYKQDDTNVLAVRGVSGDPITGALSGTTLSIEGGDGANNQSYPDEIDPVNGAEACFTYDTGMGLTSRQRAPALSAADKARGVRGVASRSISSTGTAGLRVNTGTYKLVYLSFGFEAISTAPSRGSVMASVLTWLTNYAPPAPTSVTLTPTAPTVVNQLQATAMSGGADLDGDGVTLAYQWTVSTDGGSSWGPWGHDSTDGILTSALVHGQTWKARACADDGIIALPAFGAGSGLIGRFTSSKKGAGRNGSSKVASSWVESNTVTVLNTAPPAPASLVVTPDPPTVTSELRATATSGGGDADGDPVTYSYQWALVNAAAGASKVTRSSKVLVWGHDSSDGILTGVTLHEGEVWAARAYATDGSLNSAWIGPVQVTIGNSEPTVPTQLTIAPAAPLCTSSSLVATANGSTDADTGDMVSYEYQWSKQEAGGTWGAWGHDSTDGTLTGVTFLRGDTWRVQARSTDTTVDSAWCGAVVVTIGNTRPTVPSQLAIAPTQPFTTETLVATAGGSTDPDIGDTVSYQYQWSSKDNAGTWGVWGHDSTDGTLSGVSLAEGGVWRVQARATDGSLNSAWCAPQQVIIRSSPTMPPQLTITPDEPLSTNSLVATAAGSTDPDTFETVSYQYQWSKQDVPGTWGAWGHDSTNGALTGVRLHRGEMWRVQARATDGTLVSPWSPPAQVIVGNSEPTQPTEVTIAPDPAFATSSLRAAASGSTDADTVDDVDTVSYRYEWSKQRADGTWGAWDYPSTNGLLTGVTLHHGEIWRVQALATDGTFDSAWSTPKQVTVRNSLPTVPADLTITPDRPLATSSLLATAAGSTDADSDDTVSYKYQWSKQETGGAWAVWGHESSDGALMGVILQRGETWRVQACATDGIGDSAWTAPVQVTIANSQSTVPTVTVVPVNPIASSVLTATASSSTDADTGDTVSYRYQWRKQEAVGAWAAWGYDSADGRLSGVTLRRGEVWAVRALSTDGTLESAWSTPVQVTIANSVPTAPAQLAITPAAPVCTSSLVATAAGSTDADTGDTLSYDYQWSKQEAGGAWGAWGHDSNDGSLSGVALQRGEIWRVQARAADGSLESAWTSPVQVTIGNSLVTVPAVTVLPANPDTTSVLTATASGSADADVADSISYKYQWALMTGSASASNSTRSSKAIGWAHDSTDGVLTGVTLHKGEVWAVRACATDGTLDSAWSEPVQVTIGNAAPGAPAGLAIAPASPLTGDDLASELGSATDPDGDVLSYEYQWSSDGGATWQDFGAVLSHDLTTRGQNWRVRARAYDGAEYGPYLASGAVVVVNTRPAAPLSISITPARPRTAATLRPNVVWSVDADGDRLTYRHQWSSSTDGGVTWGAWQTMPNVPASRTRRGEMWRLRSRCSDGLVWSAFGHATPVTILNSMPSRPQFVTISPQSPGLDDALSASASGAVDLDDDPISYEYQWRRSRDGGVNWSAWSWSGPTLDASLTHRGEHWMVRSRAKDDEYTSSWRQSEEVVIGGVAAVRSALSMQAVAAPSRSGVVAISVSLSTAAQVRVGVFNLAGREIAVLPPQQGSVGLNTLLWNGLSANRTALPSGTYLLRIVARTAGGSESQGLATVTLKR